MSVLHSALNAAMWSGIVTLLLVFCHSTRLLSPCCRCVQVAETDQLWEFDQLFADVSSEMMAEMEPPEKEEGEEDDDDAGVAKGDGEKRKPLSQQTVRDRSAKVDTQNK